MLYSHVTLLMLRVVDVVAKTTVQQNARHLVADIPGEVQIGALFPIHRQIPGVESCGEVWEQYGIQRTEIALQTIRKLNEELPFRLGISIRDSCWTERIAMEQTIAFLRDGVAQCSCCQTPGCNKKTAPVIAVIGPAKSSGTIAVQNLLQVFKIPQIGYSATTPDLWDSEQFRFFLRVVPSDVWQGKAIGELLRQFNWTYISAVYSAGNYGEKGYEQLEKYLSTTEVCIAHSEKVKVPAGPADFDKAIIALNSQKSRPQVVVCFCEGSTVMGLLAAQKRLRKTNPIVQPFQWIGSDAWADRKDVVQNVEEEAVGSFSLRIHSPRVNWFDNYYFALNPDNNTANPWFREFWQQKFNCTFLLAKEEKNAAPGMGLRLCTGQESLAAGYEQDPKLSQVTNSIRVVALALRQMYYDRCRDNSTLCTEILARNGSMLLQYIKQVKFTDSFSQEIFFDERDGHPPAWYDVLNYGGMSNGYQLVGEYRRFARKDFKLRMPGGSNRRLIFFDGSADVPDSVCSRPCGVGERQRETMACCWICEACQETQIVDKSRQQCTNCSIGTWPDANRTACVPLPHVYVDLWSVGSVAALVFAALGVVATAGTTAIFVAHNSTPVVKSTTRELAYTILAGLGGVYLATFAILARPNAVTCFLTRIAPPIAFSVIYAALLTKTNRIARILSSSKKKLMTKRQRFLSTSAQVVITWILVSVQVCILAYGALVDFPKAGFDPAYLPRRMVLVCPSSSTAFFSPLVWNGILIAFCTLYAVKTRNLPENFNEAKFIGFTMYCTIVVWLAFIVLHLGTMNKALTMSFSYSLSASIALVLLFFPRLYIMIFRPEKNVRSTYTTTKMIRCHFGNSQGMSDVKPLKTRNSTQSASIRSGFSGVTRTASMRAVMAAAPPSSGSGGGGGSGGLCLYPF